MFNQALLDYFSQYLMPPGGYEDFIEAKLKYFSEISLTSDDARIVVATSSYYAGVLRTAYKRFVKEQNMAADDFRAVVIEVFLSGGIWAEEWRKFFKTPLATHLIRNTLLPQWTPIGLCGASWPNLQQKLEFWCARFYPEMIAI